MSLTSGLFRTHIRWRSSQSPTLAIVLVSEGKSEVGETGFTRGVDQNVSGFNIPVDQTSGMGIMQCVGNGYETSKSRQLFLDFINASADITITEEAVVVKFQKRAHNPLLVAAGFDKMRIAVPWVGGKRLRFVFG